MSIIYSIIESPSHPNFSSIYQTLELEEHRFTDMRKAMRKLKSLQPEYVMCEFFYGYANNYAGVNISNLDVMLFSMLKYAPKVKVIVLVRKNERQYVDKLNDILPLHRVLTFPFGRQDILNAFNNSTKET